VWSGPFENLVRAQLAIPGDRALRPDDVLAQLGLDSLGTVTLLMELEEAYGVVFPDEMLVPSTFATPDALWSSLMSLTAEISAAGA
jgi:acyl carrier protein